MIATIDSKHPFVSVSRKVCITSTSPRLDILMADEEARARVKQKIAREIETSQPDEHGILAGITMIDNGDEMIPLGWAAERN